jgi:hypothetical protein
MHGEFVNARSEFAMQVRLHDASQTVVLIARLYPGIAVRMCKANPNIMRKLRTIVLELPCWLASGGV